MPRPLCPEHDASTLPQRILVVDDDPEILRLVKEKLCHEGYEVFTALSARQGLAAIERHGLPHLAIVDVRMPDVDGFEFCRAVQAFSDLPIIVLSAVDDKDTVVRAIGECAEDYVTKPFSPRELVARVARVLRRIGDFSFALEPVVNIDKRLAVDFAHQQAFVDGGRVDLTPTETKLLYVLVRNAGRVTTTSFLLRRLWPLEDVFEDALRVHVCRLRRKIEADPGQPRYIVTERGLGYRFRTED